MQFKLSISFLPSIQLHYNSKFLTFFLEKLRLENKVESLLTWNLQSIQTKSSLKSEIFYENPQTFFFKSIENPKLSLSLSVFLICIQYQLKKSILLTGNIRGNLKNFHPVWQGAIASLLSP